MLRTRIALAFCFAFCTGCAAQVGVSGPMGIPADGLAQCQSQCGQMGMGAGAVVVMANTIGCVCEPRAQGEHANRDGSALTGGMAAVVTQEERREQEQQRREAVGG